MPFTRIGTPAHGDLSGVTTAQHHTATVAGDINLADLAARAHSDLSDAPADAHQLRSHDHSDALDGSTLNPVIFNVGSGWIVFPAVQSVSGSANTFDDVERGTFTPTFQDASRSDAEGQAYTQQVGSYRKYGNMVHWTVSIAMSDKGTMANEGIVLAGLPFPSHASVGHNSACSLRTDGAVINAGQVITGVVNANGTVVDLQLWDATSGNTSLLLAEMAVSGTWVMSGTYEAVE